MNIFRYFSHMDCNRYPYILLHGHVHDIRPRGRSKAVVTSEIKLKQNSFVSDVVTCEIKQKQNTKTILKVLGLF